MSCIFKKTQDRLIPVVKDILSAFNDPSHDYQHIERVRANATQILAASPQCDDESELVMIMGALLHDVYDHKYNVETHSLTESERVRNLLHLHNTDGLWSADIIDRVCFVVQNVSYSKEMSQTVEQNGQELPFEVKVVQDADRLDAIGAIGIMRAYTFGAKRNRFLYNDDDLTREVPSDTMQNDEAGSPAYKGETTTSHFWEKLLHVRGKMKTDAGRFMAEDRHQFMMDFIEQLQSEVPVERDE